LFGGSVGGNLALALEGGAYSNPAEPNELEPAVQAPPGTDIYYGTPGRPASEPAPRLTATDYPRYGKVDSRLAIWVVRDPVAAVRYDRLARDFLRISLIAFSISSLLGVTLVAALLAFYPTFLRYITGVFKSMMGIYAVVFLAESWALYLYYYSWDRLSEGGHKWFHAAIGVMVLHDVAGRRGSGRPVPRKFLAHAPHRLVESLQRAPIFGRYDDRRGRGLGVLGLPFPHGEEPGPERLL
jgi:hypothetical protein